MRLLCLCCHAAEAVGDAYALRQFCVIRCGRFPRIACVRSCLSASVAAVGNGIGQIMLQPLLSRPCFYKRLCLVAWSMRWCGCDSESLIFVTCPVFFFRKYFDLIGLKSPLRLADADVEESGELFGFVLSLKAIKFRLWTAVTVNLMMKIKDRLCWLLSNHKRRPGEIMRQANGLGDKALEMIHVRVDRATWLFRCLRRPWSETNHGDIKWDVA